MITMNNIDKMAKIYVAGHRGMVGSSIVRALEKKGYQNILKRTHAQLDLTSQKEVRDFFYQERPDYVFLAAAKVGGIYANSAQPGEFIYSNLMIQTNVLDAAYKTNVTRLLFLGSSCIYPKLASQPMSENVLMTGPLEPTNEAYAIAKIAGIKMCEAYNRQYGTKFRSVMPTNLYGQNDNFDPQTSHVIPGLIQKFHHAKMNNEQKVIVWGTGTAKREFLHVDDMAKGCLIVMNLQQEEYQAMTDPFLSHINLGTGKDISIKELAEMIKEVVEFKGQICFNSEIPDGTPRKLLNTGLIEKMGFSPSVDLQQGIEHTYTWFVNHSRLTKSASFLSLLWIPKTNQFHL